MHKIPQSVKREARLGLALKAKGYQGGTATGWGRARQLISQTHLDINTLAVMRAWYARHGPDAKNGGTSYRGYLRWLDDGQPADGYGTHLYRGAVAWLIWGGDAAYEWLKTEEIRRALALRGSRRRQRKSGRR